MVHLALDLLLLSGVSSVTSSYSKTYYLWTNVNVR